ETTITQPTKDATELRNEAQSSLKQSKKLRDKAENTLKYTIWCWIGVLLVILLIDLSDNNMNPYLFLSWLPAFTIISTPIFALAWFYGRESEKTKNQADEFQRGALLKEVMLYFSDDRPFQKEIVKQSLSRKGHLEDALPTTSGGDSFATFLSSGATKGTKVMNDITDKSSGVNGN
ncbi:MAG: hypothetical protein OXF24_04025, partial [Hyphomicrobiales bacterium]|nr:hypothetical protein [Hyphomicrobiales bacterium]